jgi:hypothetical protein
MISIPIEVYMYKCSISHDEIPVISCPERAAHPIQHSTVLYVVLVPSSRRRLVRLRTSNEKSEVDPVKHVVNNRLP